MATDDDRMLLSQCMLAAGIKWTAVPEPSSDGLQHWLYRFTRPDGRVFTTPFYTGLRGSEMSGNSVLWCLLSDAASVERSGDFEAWRQELDPEQNLALLRRMYRRAVERAEQLREFLGADYEAWLWETD